MCVCVCVCVCVFRCTAQRCIKSIVNTMNYWVYIDHDIVTLLYFIEGKTV